MLDRFRAAVPRLSADIRIVSDPASFARLLHMRVERSRLGEVDEPGPSTVPLRIRRLGGRLLHLRPRTADLQMLDLSFLTERHLPPPELGGDPRTIVELGTNVATTLCDLAHRYPGARVLGVEPDPGNAAVARRNLAEFGDRAQLVEAAAWDTEADLTVERQRREWGLVVRPRRPGDPDRWPRVRGRPVDTLLRDFAGDDPIDLLLMEVEGGELRLLGAAGDWAPRVRSAIVTVEEEHHGDVPATEGALRALGFKTRVRSSGVLTSVIAVR